MATPIVDELPTTTPTPILISPPSYTTTTGSADVPTVTDSTKINSSEFCIAPIAPWSCSCGVLSNEFLQIKNASQAGLCTVTVPLNDREINGYNITLPDNWFCKIVGAASTNLRCVSDNNQKIFLQSLVTKLPVIQADEAVSVFQEGEGYFSNPVVDVGEKKVSRGFLTIGDKKVLRLLTQQKDMFILRYFVKSEDSLYILNFEMKDPGSQENQQTSIMLEEAILSMQFRR